MKTRIYAVLNGDDGTQVPRVVEAPTAAQAIRHVTQPYEALPISALELIALQKDFPQLVIEKAGAE